MRCLLQSHKDALGTCTITVGEAGPVVTHCLIRYFTCICNGSKGFRLPFISDNAS